MPEAATKLPVKTDQGADAPSRASAERRPFVNLRQEIDRLFNDFDPWRIGAPRAFFAAEAKGFGAAVDIVEKDKAFEVTAELPGMSEKDVHVELVNGSLRIQGEKKEEREEKRKDYHLSERRYGSFERRFPIPDGVDVEKIDASFREGVLTIIMPKTADAQMPAKTIPVKGA